MEFEGMGIGERKTEEFRIGRREERRGYCMNMMVEEFQGNGGDASHGARTHPSHFNSNYVAYLFTLILNCDETPIASTYSFSPFILFVLLFIFKKTYFVLIFF